MRKPGLLALDLDGVLLKGDSSWGRYHQLLGTEKERKRTMELFFSKAIDYPTWARMDAELWKGMDSRPVQEYLCNLQVAPGAVELVSKMHSLGIISIMISTGISAVAEKVGEILGMDAVKANDVEVLDGRLTGKVRINCGFDEKGLVLRRMARGRAIPLERCACVGDDENDISMFEAVPFSLAYNPKSNEVARKASMVIKGDLHQVRRVLIEHFKSLSS